MATDLETAAETGEVALARPNLKITGLHIRGLKSIGSLDLPGDGLGWDRPIPDFLMVGGINGSGKTTLLNFIVRAFEYFARALDFHGVQELPAELQAAEARIDIQFSIPGMVDERFRFLIGDKSFLSRNGESDWFGFESVTTLPGHRGLIHHQAQARVVSSLETWLYRVSNGDDYRSPSIVSLPCDRDLVVPETPFKMPSNLTPSDQFVQRWQPPKRWKDSLAARLYALRWEDLNAKEEGRPEEATQFNSYQLAFDRIFEGRKRLRWSPKGELVVETNSGATHDLSELSSGEKQVILIVAELLYRWRPGSIILIDEPELHLHEAYQTKLWESLLRWQKERGGQVIVATQSDHLFGISDPEIKILLSNRRGR